MLDRKCKWIVSISPTEELTFRGPNINSVIPVLLWTWFSCWNCERIQEPRGHKKGCTNVGDKKSILIYVNSWHTKNKFLSLISRLGKLEFSKFHSMRFNDNHHNSALFSYRCYKAQLDNLKKYKTIFTWNWFFIASLCEYFQMGFFTSLFCVKYFYLSMQRHF